jgi:Tfp pilus assembly major pilin PilA
MNPQAPMPGRHGLSYVLAMFVPFAGRLGAGFGFLILVYIIAVLAAIAVPAYQDYTIKAKLSAVIVESQGTRAALGNYYQTQQKVPESLAEVGLPSQLSNSTKLSLNPENMVLTVSSPQGELIFTPRTDVQNHVIWDCEGGEELKPKQLPATCQKAESH